MAPPGRFTRTPFAVSVSQLAPLGLALALVTAVFVSATGLFARPEPRVFSGVRLDRVGDVDGDGAEDVLAVEYAVDGAWNELGPWLPNRRRARHDLRVLSGRTGERLHASRETSNVAEGVFGTAPLGDIDGDGHGDVVLGCERIDGRWTERLLVARSGDDWSELWRANVEGFGSSRARDRVLVVEEGAGGPVVLVASRSDSAEAFDGRDGSRVDARNVSAPEVVDHAFPVALVPSGGVPVGDVDGDGTDDVLTSPSGYTGDAPVDARVVSGRSGAELAAVSFGAPGRFLERAFPLGDADRDGVADFAVLLGGEGTAGLLAFVSGATGEVLDRVVGGPDGLLEWQPAVTIADVDGDGLRELVAHREQRAVAAWSGPRLLWAER